MKVDTQGFAVFPQVFLFFPSLLGLNVLIISWQLYTVFNYHKRFSRAVRFISGGVNSLPSRRLKEIIHMTKESRENQRKGTSRVKPVWKYMSHENRNTHLMREIECAGSENPMRKFPVNHVIIYLWRSCDSSVMVSRASLINWVISPGHPGIDFLLGALGFNSPNSSKAPLLSNLPSPQIVFIISRGVWGCVRRVL